MEQPLSELLATAAEAKKYLDIARNAAAGVTRIGEELRRVERDLKDATRNALNAAFEALQVYELLVDLCLTRLKE